MEALIVPKFIHRQRSLRVCAIIYGVFHVFTSTALLAFTFGSYLSLDSFWEKLRNFLKTSFNLESDLKKLQALLLSLMSYFIIWFIVDIIHLYAVLKENRRFLFPWLILNGTSIVAVSFLIVSVAIIYPKILFALLIIPILTCSYLVSHSYYFELKDVEGKLQPASNSKETNQEPEEMINQIL